VPGETFAPSDPYLEARPESFKPGKATCLSLVGQFVKPSEANAAAACLKRIEQLWQKLERTLPRTPKYAALIDQIRAETDAFRKILDAQRGIDSQDPKD